MAMLRRLLGDALRRERQTQHRTLREVSSAARVSLGYLSEVERGQKEASSELLASICEALEVRLSEVLREVSDDMALAEGSEAREAAEAAPAPVDARADFAAGLPVGRLSAARRESRIAGVVVNRAARPAA